MKNIIYSNGGNLIYESFNIRTIINVEGIDNILIYNIDGSTYSNQLDIYLDLPVKYEVTKKTIINSILLNVFLLFHKNQFLIEITIPNNDLLIFIQEIKKNIKNVVIPENIENSFFWSNLSNNYEIKGYKLLYSKKNEKLYEVLNKHNKIREL